MRRKTQSNQSIDIANKRNSPLEISYGISTVRCPAARLCDSAVYLFYIAKSVLQNNTFFLNCFYAGANNLSAFLVSQVV